MLAKRLIPVTLLCKVVSSPSRLQTEVRTFERNSGWYKHHINQEIKIKFFLTLIPEELIGRTAFQLAPESIVTSSVSDEFNVLRIAHMYWSISR